MSKLHECLKYLPWVMLPLSLTAAEEDWKGAAKVTTTVVDAYGRRQDLFQGLAASASRQGCRVAKVIGNILDGFTVRVDGKSGARYDEIARETPVFTGDGSSIAYAARRLGNWTWVVNGVEGPAFPELTATSFAFSADGRHHAYIGIPRFRSTALVVDGKVQVEAGWEETMPWDAAPVFNRDGSRLAYVEIRRRERKMRINLAGSPLPWHDGIALVRSAGFGAFGPSTGDLSGAAAERARPEAFGMHFSQDGQHFAYAMFEAGLNGLIVDGKQIGLHEAYGFDFTFSPDASDYACMMWDGTKRWVISAKRSPLQIEKIFDWSITFSPNGRHLAFSGVREGRMAVWMDGRPAPCDMAFKDCPNWKAIQFSPDSNRLAFLVSTDAAMHWVVDGKADPGARIIGTNVTLDFSPDSKHYVYAAADAVSDGVRILVDGKERARHAVVACGPVFRSDGILEYLAIEETDLMKYEVRLE
jgi:dipeptidyl aminopeptidase/acylaminoacyl peptidase